MERVISPMFFSLRVLATVLGLGIAVTASAGGVSAAETSVWSFNMWCIEMEMLPSERCSERRPEDWTAYQTYISRTERFEQEISEEERRQAEAQQRLDRQSPNPGARIP